ncbi:MAG: hypothetical protein HQL48_02695 [Gammaproteobacteria bacterium]|nr:hypothetical protein [Gammaproteobacteria bacterium]
MKKGVNVSAKRSNLLRSLWLPLLAAPLLVSAWVAYATYVSDHGIPVSSDGSWSSEVLENIHVGIVAASPIPVANACGMGASSCFKCHNGKRAGVASPEVWHNDHSKVNHSCVGCHKGNERLMLEKMAHQKMVNDPRTEPEKICMDCHKDGDQQALLATYNSAQ